MKYLIATIFAIAFLLPNNNLSGQNQEQDRLLYSINATALLDGLKGPVNSQIDTFSNRTLFSRVDGLCLASIGATVRYNLYEFGPDLAICAAASPSFGLFIDEASFGIGRFSSPLTVGLDYGVGSTYYTELDFGAFFRVGMDLHAAPLFGFDIDEVPTDEFVRSWILPTAQTGIRVFTRDRCYELCLTRGLGKEFLYKDDEVVRVSSFRLSLGYMFAY